jgi:hypothetical protein
MLVKCQSERYAVMLMRVCNRLAQDLLMTQVNAVKKTNREANSFAVRFQLVCGVENVHRNGVFTP